MSAVDTKPIVPVDAAAPSTVAEPTPATAPASTVTEDKPVETAEPATTEAAPETAAAAPVEAKKEEKAIEPIYSGTLGYKAPGLKNAFRYSKKHFWFGEEPVSSSSLSQYLRGEKPEHAHPTAAWSSVTGKGLLFFAKHADQKETPAGVLNLAEATDLTKDGLIAFHFKLHGSKHSFETTSASERSGWYLALEKAVEEAKASKEGIVGSEGYKEHLSQLGKPSLAAAAVAAPKKSTEVPTATKAAEPEAVPTEEAVIPARAGSSSSSEGENKKKASKSKSRSLSRGKRASIFGGLLGKKDKVEEKHEEKKVEKELEKEVKKDETPVVADETAGAAATPALAEEVPKTAEEPAVEPPAAVAASVAPIAPVGPIAPAAVAEEPKEEKKIEEKPKPTKRGSIFGNFVEKLKSPTQEKKELDLKPVPAAKEPEVAAEAPKIEEPVKAEETPAVAAVDDATEAPKVEEPAKTAITPAKEKQHFSFGKFLGGSKEKVKTPTAEKAVDAPKTEEAVPVVEETPAPVAPVEPTAPAVAGTDAVETPATEAKTETKEEPATDAATTTTTTTPTSKKRASIFGALGGSVKKDKDGEEKPQGLKGLFRKASSAGRTTKKEKETTPPAKVDEVADTKETAEATAPVTEKTETPAAPAQPATIGDVVPEAISVGQAPKSAPEVTSTA